MNMDRRSALRGFALLPFGLGAFSGVLEAQTNAGAKSSNFFDLWQAAKEKAKAGEHRDAVLAAHQALNVYTKAYAAQNPKSKGMATDDEMKRAFAGDVFEFIHREVIAGIRDSKALIDNAKDAIKVIENIHAKNPKLTINLAPNKTGFAFNDAIDSKENDIRLELENIDFLLRQDIYEQDLTTFYITLRKAGIDGDDYYDRDAIRYSTKVQKPSVGIQRNQAHSP